MLVDTLEVLSEDVGDDKHPPLLVADFEWLADGVDALDLGEGVQADAQEGSEWRTGYFCQARLILYDLLMNSTTSFSTTIRIWSFFRYRRIRPLRSRCSALLAVGRLKRCRRMSASSEARASNSSCIFSRADNNTLGEAEHPTIS